MAVAMLATTALADPCGAPLPGKGTAFAGTVRYVGDGDSLCVGRSPDRRSWVEVRMADFNAPELGSPAGLAAKAALQRVALGRSVMCKAEGRSYDRVVARCRIGRTSIGTLMRKAGVREGGR